MCRPVLSDRVEPPGALVQSGGSNEPGSEPHRITADPDTLRFTRAFRSIRRGYAVRKIEAATVMGLMTLDELEILLILAARAEPVRMGELASLAQSNPANTARTVKLLSTKQFVQRSPSALDKRSALVGVTPTGHEVAERMRDRRARLVGAVIRALPGNGEYVIEALEQLGIALEQAATETS